MINKITNLNAVKNMLIKTLASDYDKPVNITARDNFRKQLEEVNKLIARVK